jgi:hypothetical protein
MYWFATLAGGAVKATASETWIGLGWDLDGLAEVVWPGL